MSNDDSRLDADFETAELRRLLDSTGVSDYVNEGSEGVDLETADSLIARLKAAEAADATSRRPAGEAGRPRVRTLLVGTAAAVVAGIVIVFQPWDTQVARAGTPPILDFEFAEANRIADAPGVDPSEVLGQLARAAEQTQSGRSRSAVQHVVTEGWSIESDFDADPDSTITPTRSEKWLYADGRYRERYYKGEPLKADGRGIPIGGRLDRKTRLFDEETRPAGSEDAQFFNDMPDSIEGVRAAFLDRIQCLERKRGQERTLCTFTQVDDLAGMYVIPSDVMASIWRMLAQEEGIRSLGHVRDRTGRNSVALSFIWEGDPDYRFVLLADPRTGQVVGRERILIKPSPSSPVKPPAIQDFTAIVESETQ